MTTEADMALRGQLRARSSLHKKLDKGDVASMQAGVALSKRVLAKYIESFEQWIDQVLDGKAGRSL